MKSGRLNLDIKSWEKFIDKYIFNAEIEKEECVILDNKEFNDYIQYQYNHK